MPVAYQSRAVTEPQREMARRSRDGGIVGTNYAKVFFRLRRREAYYKGIACTPARWGPTFL